MRLLFSAVIIIVLLLGLASAVNTSLHILERGDGVEEAKKRLAEAEEEQKRLLEALERAGSPEFVEGQAREKLGLARVGETVVVLPTDEVLRKFAPSQAEEELFLEALPVWRRWVRLFLPDLEKSLP